MRTFTVHAPPDSANEATLSAEAAERAVFIKDGFCWPALFVPVLWILWHRLWLTLVCYLVALLIVAVIARFAGETAAVILAGLGAVLFALEANNIRRWSLASRRWREVGISSGRSIAEAEIRYLGAQADEASAAPPPPVPLRPPVQRRVEDDAPVLGMFAEPGR